MATIDPRTRDHIDAISTILRAKTPAAREAAIRDALEDMHITRARPEPPPAQLAPRPFAPAPPEARARYEAAQARKAAAS